VEERFEIAQWDVFVFLRKLEAPALDFVFLDPPRNFGRYEKLLKTVGNLPFLQPDTWIILEAFKKTKLDCLPDTLNVFRRLRVGDSQLVFLRPLVSGP
jgi:16S rRNA G966 N2-methylase RsmD